MACLSHKRYGIIVLMVTILILNCTAILLHAQDNIRFKHFSVDDGLSSNWIKAIYQDRYGYMWFGTGGNGVNRYDGYNIKVYKNQPGNPNTLSDNFVNSIYEDKNGDLWIGTNVGVSKYNRELDRMEPCNKIPPTYIVGFYESDEEEFYIVTIDNILKTTLKADTSYFIAESSGSESKWNSMTIVKDYAGNLWLGTNHGVKILDANDNSLKSFNHNPNDPHSLCSDNLRTVYLDTKGRVWLGADDNGISLMKYKDGDFSKPFFINSYHNLDNDRGLSKGSVLSMLDAGNRHLWVGYENGGIDIIDINSFERGEPIIQKVSSNIYDAASLSGKTIYSLFKDNQGTIWIGTYANGVSYYNDLIFKFDHYKHIPNQDNTILNNIVNAIYKKGDELWVATEEGVNLINTKTNQYKKYTHNFEDEGSLGANAVLTVFEDSNQNMWFGTWAGGLNKLNRADGRFDCYTTDATDEKSISSNNVFSIIEDKQDYLWLASGNGGLNRFDPNTREFKSYQYDESINSISDDWLFALKINSYGEFWISTSVSVEMFDYDKELFYAFKHDPNDKTSISYNGAEVIFEDSERNMWFGTAGGLNAFIREDSSFICYQEKDGLPDNYIQGILEDDHGNLWLSSKKGISKFINGIGRPDSAVFINFGKVSGLQGEEFRRRSCFKDEDGYMYFGGNNGFNVFHPDSLKNNSFIPPVVLTGFSLFYKSVTIGAEDSPLTNHISLCKDITLKHYQSVFSIEFSALSFIASENNQYKYILDGFDDQWNEVGENRVATYTNLDPGKYLFRVLGSNGDGVWNKAGAELKITILSPWWKTLWFRGLVFVFIVSVIVGFYYYRLNRLTIQKRELEHKVKLRTAEIEDKNRKLRSKTEDLNEVNTILEERQQQIEEQAEELKASAEELQSNNDSLVMLNATKDKFFSIIAHDLKNPFSSVLGFCDLLILRYDKFDNAKRKQMVSNIGSAANNIYKLLENLLQWARSQTGAIKYEPEEFLFAALVDDIVALVSDLLKAKDLVLTRKIPAELKVFADKNMMFIIIQNLLMNAIKFSEKSDITIEVQESKSELLVKVIDKGVGIYPELIANIFGVESSKSTTGTQGETGTGLGLIICKEFIDKHQGKIGVESELGKGSTFYFTIPQ